MLKRLLFVAFFAATVAFVAFVIPASAGNGPPSSPPGQDPCSHGNTGKDCRPDPQPDNGKDCEYHGNNGGVNEDHCGPGDHPPVHPPSPPGDHPPVHPPNNPPSNPPSTTPTVTTPPAQAVCPRGKPVETTSTYLICEVEVTVTKEITKVVFGKPKCPKGFKKLKSKPGTALCVKTVVKNKVKFVTKVRVVQAPKPAPTR